MENQTELRQTTIDSFAVVKASSPEFKEHYEGINAEIFKNGVLTGKAKRLMALAVGISHGCRGCMLFQTQAALEHGASVDEILETCTLATVMAGNMGGANAARVVTYLQELGLIDHKE